MALENLLTEQEVGMVVVDGLGYSVAGDNHNYGVIGSALSALAAMAERTDCAILGLTHPPKGASDSVTAAIGSTAWTAVSRIVWVLGYDPDDEAKRVVRVSKSNFKMPDDGLSFRIGDDQRHECGFVTGLAAGRVSAEELVAASIPPPEGTEREEAKQLVRSVLKPGPMETAELLKITRAAGVSDRTVERARRDLGVRATPRNDATTGKMIGWMVELPNHSATTPPDARCDGVGGVGGVGLTSSFSNSVSSSPPSPPSPPTTPSLTPDGPLLENSLFEEDDF